MTVTYRANLGAHGTLTWETSEKDFVDHFHDPELREYIQNNMGRLLIVFMGAMRSSGTGDTLGEFHDTITAYATKLRNRLKELGAN